MRLKIYIEFCLPFIYVPYKIILHAISITPLFALARERSDRGNLAIDCFVSWRRLAMPRKNVQVTIMVAAPCPL